MYYAYIHHRNQYNEQQLCTHSTLKTKKYIYKKNFKKTENQPSWIESTGGYIYLSFFVFLQKISRKLAFPPTLQMFFMFRSSFPLPMYNLTTTGLGIVCPGKRKKGRKQEQLRETLRVLQAAQSQRRVTGPAHRQLQGKSEWSWPGRTATEPLTSSPRGPSSQPSQGLHCS